MLPMPRRQRLMTGLQAAAPRHCPPIAATLFGRSSRSQTAARALQEEPVQAARLKRCRAPFESSALHLQEDGALEARVSMD